MIRIAIDLDGVLTEQLAPLARAANEKFGLDLDDSAFVDSAGHQVPDEVRNWVYAEDGPAFALAPNPDAAAFLEGTVDLLGPDRVMILTARPESSSEMTLKWLRRHGLDRCNVVFADDKVSVAREHGVTHAVEDSVRHTKAYQEAGIDVFFVANGGEAPVEVKSPVGGLSEIRDQVAALGSDNDKSRTELPTIVISDVIDAGAHDRLSGGGSVIDVDGTDRKALLDVIGGADALVVRSETQVDAELIAHAPKLRVVARAGVGVDNIDIDAATEAGIVVLNAPGANSISAGEHTFAIMLAIARQLTAANTSMHAGKWERKKFKLFDLYGKTVGIVGLGRVGRVLATRLQAFGVHVIAHDPYVGADTFRRMDVERVSYQELLATSDIVSYHVPLTDETYHYLSRETIPNLKRGAVVINCARGDVVDHEALAEALDNGHIAAAGVDVYPVEPLEDSPLWGRENVVLTPHIGGSSYEAQATVGDVISRSVLASLRGEAVPNAVNLPDAAIEPGISRKLALVAGAAGHLLSVLEPETPHDFSMSTRGNVSDEIAELVYTIALSGGLQRWSDERVTPVNARMTATPLGIEQHISRYNAPDENSVAFEFSVQNEDAHHVTVHWTGDEVGIYEVDRFSLGQPLSGDVLISHHDDQPGIVGRMGSVLGDHGVNIAGMQLGRMTRGGEAIMVVNVDDPISDELMAEILADSHVKNAYVVSLPTVD